jgi:MoaA/NifB/PqqE/SkfB family radical SAM enzyme
MHNSIKRLVLGKLAQFRDPYGLPIPYIYLLNDPKIYVMMRVIYEIPGDGIVYSMPFWDDIFSEVKQSYPEIKTKSTHIDALSDFFVSKPHTFDVLKS